MATIVPFRGVRFNQELAGAIADLVCPPYDIISHDQQQALYRKNPHNVIRLEFGLESPGDTDTDNRYVRSAAALEEWVRTGALKRDQEPALYVYEMEYQADGKDRKLRGFVGLVRIEEYDSGVIRPHETTLSGPKTDRLRLLRACRASFSQIFSLFSDPAGTVRNVLGREQAHDAVEIRSSDNVTHRFWPMTDRSAINAVVAALQGTDIFIADGHHRYDTALNYRNERRIAAGSYTGHEGFNFVSMFLAPIEDPGLTVLPAHRALFNLDDFHPRKFEEDLNRYFNIERIDFDARSELADRRTVLETMGHRSDHAHIFGMRVRGEQSYYLLTLRNESDMDGIVPERSPAYRRLDVSILHHLIIDRLLGIRMDTHKLGLNIEYIKEADVALERVAKGDVEIVFLMNPTKVSEVRDVALAGERMPQKATYFYPKLLTGLVMHKLD
jgi:uncharacterized protein (DUF1015 family)